jgi:molybdopterin-guanine dinucleotide biosynthesis adapter protein
MKVFAITGYSGTGKTTLIEKLIAQFAGEGLCVAALKHAHEGFDIDTPGKDSYRMRAAGARQVLVSAPRRWVLMEELPDADEPSLEDHLQRLRNADLVLVEGWKNSVLPKLEVRRIEVNKPVLYPGDPRIKAVACNYQHMALRTGITIFNLNDVTAIATFVREQAVTLPEIALLRAQQLQMQSQQQ